MIGFIRELNRRSKNISKAWPLGIGFASVATFQLFYEMTSIGFIGSFTVALVSAWAIVFTHAWFNGKNETR